jgi:hypothetical protein
LTGFLGVFRITHQGDIVMTRYFRSVVAFAATLFALVGTARPAEAWGSEAIWDLKVIYGDDSNIACGPGWDRVGVDLNAGAGGDYVYLCVSRDRGTHSTPIAGIYVCVITCPPGYDVVRGEPSTFPGYLNSGAGGWPLMFGYYRGNTNPVRQIGFSLVDEDASKPSCRYIDADPDPYPPTPDLWEPMPGVQDLNRGAGGKYVYPCLKYMPGGTRDADGLVWDLSVANEALFGCPSGYDQAGPDLNHGVDGFNEYPRLACIERQSDLAWPEHRFWESTAPIATIGTVARDNNSTTPLEKPCAEIGGWKIEPGVMSEGWDTSFRQIYFCASRAHSPQDPDRSIVDLQIVALSERPDNPSAVCGQQLGNAYEPVWAINEEGVNDLNAGEGGSFLYACVKKGPTYRAGAFEGPSFNLANGSTVLAPATLVSGNLLMAESFDLSTVLQATDAIDANVPMICTRPIVSTYMTFTTLVMPVPVTCIATDSNGYSTAVTVMVVVVPPPAPPVDDTPPSITAPADLRVEATGPNGALVDEATLGSATSADHDVASITRAPAGNQFALGTTVITWMISDTAGNSSVATQTVVVADTTPPAVNALPQLVFDATSANGVTLESSQLPEPVAIDAVGIAWIRRSPAGFDFPLGATTVTWSIADAAGNVAHPKQTIIVRDTTAPVIAEPGTLTFEATGANGITLTPAQLPNPSATDLVGVSSITREPAGFAFALGTTTITWSAADAAGNIGTATQTIVVRDTTAPVFTVTGDGYIYQTAASSQGGIANYTVNATDAIDGSLVATCSIPSGTMVPMGEHQVTCTATDRSGNAATRTFTLLMGDYEPPVMTAPAEVIVEATGLLTPVTFPVTALDAIAGPVEVRCLPKMGSSLPIGTTIVRCGADDGWLNVAEPSKTTVIVRDTTAPVLSLPAALQVQAPSGSGVNVSYTASALDLVDGSLPANCSPASGGTFAIGVTTVSCIARDAHGNTANDSFTIEVTPPTAEQLIAALDRAIEVRRLDKQLHQILRSIERNRDRRACAQIAQLRRAIVNHRTLAAGETLELVALVDALEAAVGCN